MTELPYLQYVRSLEQFEGDILSEHQAEDGSVYLKKFCTIQDGIEISLIVRAFQEDIELYLMGRISMLALLTTHKQAWLIRQELGQPYQASPIQMSDCQPYLPAETAMHDLDLGQSHD